MTPAEWDALEAARTNWHEVCSRGGDDQWAVPDAQFRLTRELMAHLDELVAGVRPKCPGCEGDGTQMYQRGWVRKTCPTCNDSGLIHDPDATTEGQWNEGIPCPGLHHEVG